MVRIRPRRQGGWLKWVVIASGLVAMLAGTWLGWQRFMPNNTILKLDYGSDHPIIYKGTLVGANAIVGSKDAFKLPLAFIQEQLGLQEEVYYEKKSGSIILTGVDKLLRLKTNTLTATINSKPYKLNIAAEVKNDTVYIPVTPLEELYGIHVEYDQKLHTVTVIRAGEAVQRAEAPEGGHIRNEPTIKAPIVQTLDKKGEVRIWGESEGWYKVQSTNGGIIGYTAKDDLKLTKVEQIALPPEAVPFPAWKVIGQKINLTWEAVYSSSSINTDNISDMPGVNVVSPTWFELADAAGNIKSIADMHYVNWAHNRGMQVWGLFSNGFEPKRTTAALASVNSRFTMIQQLLAYAKMYKLQGINIDFENVETSDKENLVQFVRELTPLLHEQGIIVSIDVSPKSNSEMWSAFLNRASLGKVVDYMMIMAYDEHWASSPNSGSVASLPWVENALVKIIEEDHVPTSKLILGMPLYTRLWTEKTDKNGATDVSSKAIGMDAVAKIISEHKLTPVLDSQSRQHYVQYSENGALKRIWIEDGLSMQGRTAIAKKYGLAGVATWQRAFQSKDIWAIIHQSLTKLP
ncbi:glycosyl hydrolase family 18 protein [Paenibacillus solisilvae]|uniref:Glycosyl hydrolase family 18 protein n=1 Tax=Paenibacillus solisilvae TaxID=2486751 RepID=A0ABW0VT09_9BACL